MEEHWSKNHLGGDDISLEIFFMTTTNNPPMVTI
jgi:hypothetical protein